MATDHERSESASGGLSRRQVLARGAVAAGVVWAAPVIRTASAYATSAAGTERPCTKFYVVCLDMSGPRPIRFDDPDWEYDEMPADSVLARFRPAGDPAPSTTTTLQHHHDVDEQHVVHDHQQHVVDDHEQHDHHEHDPAGVRRPDRGPRPVPR